MTRAFVLASLLAAAVSSSALAAPVDPASAEGAAIRAKIAQIDSIIDQYRKAGRKVPGVMKQQAVSSEPMFMRLATGSYGYGSYGYGGYGYNGYGSGGYAINGDRAFGLSRWPSSHFPTFYTGTGVAASSGSSFRLQSLVNRRAYLESRLASGSVQN